MKKIILSALFATGLVAGIEAAPTDTVTQADLQAIIQRLNKLEAENKAQAARIAELEGKNKALVEQAAAEKKVATVTVAADAVLELVGVAGRLPNLAGEGVVRLEDARPELTGACSFSGAFDGYGCLTFAMDGEQVGAFTFADFAIRVTNAERARTWTVGGGAPTSCRWPRIAPRPRCT